MSPPAHNQHARQTIAPAATPITTTGQKPEITSDHKPEIASNRTQETRTTPFSLRASTTKVAEHRGRSRKWDKHNKEDAEMPITCLADLQRTANATLRAAMADERSKRWTKVRVFLAFSVSSKIYKSKVCFESNQVTRCLSNRRDILLLCKRSKRCAKVRMWYFLYEKLWFKIINLTTSKRWTKV